MSTGKITIDGQLVEIDGAKNILELVRRTGIELPTFCYHSELSVYGACRLCLVEVDRMGLVAACSTPPQDGMVVHTTTPRTQRLRKMVIELLLANHDRECTTCAKSGSCKLQELAQKFGVRKVRFGERDNRLPVDETSFSIIQDKNKCILCGDCVRTCKEIQGIGIWDFAFRGSKTVVTTAFGKDLAEVACVNCGQCVAACPTGALSVKSEIDKVWAAIHDPHKTVVAQIAPAVRVAISEEFGAAATGSEKAAGKIVAGLKKIGFDKVFDTVFAADMTAIEESHEFLDRLANGGKLPLLTSCCPGWVKYCEQYHADLLDNVSSCRSPQQMFGSLVKKQYAPENGLKANEVFVVSIMPCTAKKFEAKRPEFTTDGSPDVDAVLTTTEAAQMFKEAGLIFSELEAESFDNPLGMSSGAGLIFGATGGVTEAVVRYVTGLKEQNLGRLMLQDVRGMKNVKTANIQVDGTELKLAVVHGLANVEKLIQQVKNGEAVYHLIEVMACPGGCVGGGGQPFENDTQARIKRSKDLYSIDRMSQIHRPQDNSFVDRAFKKYYDGVNTEVTHHELHTHYTPRRRISGKLINVNETNPVEAVEIEVCVGTCCYLRGSYDVLKTLNSLIEENDLVGSVNLKGTFCLEKCNSGVSIKVDGEVITGITPENVVGLFQDKILSRVKSK